jgi:alcohol dehydrogenase class IV
MTGEGPITFATGGRPQPKVSMPGICIPPAAGGGSELSPTIILTSEPCQRAWVENRKAPLP